MAYYRDEAEKFGMGTGNFCDVFAEFDFIQVDGECDFFCPECRDMLKCKSYQDTKDEWEMLYMQYSSKSVSYVFFKVR